MKKNKILIPLSTLSVGKNNEYFKKYIMGPFLPKELYIDSFSLPSLNLHEEIICGKFNKTTDILFDEDRLFFSTNTCVNVYYFNTGIFYVNKDLLPSRIDNKVILLILKQLLPNIYDIEYVGGIKRRIVNLF